MLFFISVLTSVTALAYSTQCNEKGTKSYVYCVSKTEFTLEPEGLLLSCADGLVCADVPEICSETEKPLCQNTYFESEALCNECDPHVTETSTLVCLNETTFGFCIQGAVSQSLVFNCLPPTPYCKIVPGVSSCTAQMKALDCPVSEATTTTDSSIPSLTFTCTQSGFFLDSSDSTCSSYFKCQQTVEGDFLKYTYKCQSNFAFDPTFRHCVLKSSFSCPYNM